MRCSSCCGLGKARLHSPRSSKSSSGTGSGTGSQRIRPGNSSKVNTRHPGRAPSASWRRPTPSRRTNTPPQPENDNAFTSDRTGSVMTSSANMTRPFAADGDAAEHDVTGRVIGEAGEDVVQLRELKVVLVRQPGHDLAAGELGYLEEVDRALVLGRYMDLEAVVLDLPEGAPRCCRSSSCPARSLRCPCGRSRADAARSHGRSLRDSWCRAGS